MKNIELNKFTGKVLLFISPFIILLILELFILPIDFFTFRAWEALSVYHYKYPSIFPGPFYPDMDLTKTEQGDLGAHTKFATTRQVEWHTDKFGYRKKNGDNIKNDIVIIGDSNIVGTSLTQEEILSEVLEKKLKKRVYPLAPGNINIFLNEKRFTLNPPNTVILALLEANLSTLPQASDINININPKIRLEEEIKYKLMDSKLFQKTIIFSDRIARRNMYHYFISNISRFINQFFLSPDDICVYPIPDEFHSENKFMIFGKNTLNFGDNITQYEVDKIVNTIKEYKDILTSKGINFIFLPIPAKSAIYYQFINGKKKPVFLNILIKELKAKDINVVDINTPFEYIVSNKGKLLYQTDDSHWNAYGIEITSDLIITKIKSQK